LTYQALKRFKCYTIPLKTLISTTATSAPLLSPGYLTYFCISKCHSVLLLSFTRQVSPRHFNPLAASFGFGIQLIEKKSERGFPQPQGVSNQFFEFLISFSKTKCSPERAASKTHRPSCLKTGRTHPYASG
jgi:hypothetical protein